MSYDNKNKRKNYFIKKRFQLDFIIKFCLLMVSGLAISTIGLYIVGRSSLTTSFVNSRLSIISTADYMLPALLWITLFVVFLIGTIAALVIMHLSHRIAGAMFNIERSVNEIGKGNLTCEVRLRSKDQVKEMAESLNKMTRSLKDQIFMVKEASVDLGASIDKMASEGTRDSNLKEGLKELKQKKEVLDKLLKHFQI
ncbi:MAG: methyl-accepting chemotaxis protein [Candidatus Omnitrophica bacterium]|nr:methyl-accepting chemotaxis protein [Candidatus Omnitrophota bacterium]